MIGFAHGVAQLGDLATAPARQAALHGLKVAAVAVVAQGIRGTARGLCPDGPRRALAGVAAALALGLPWLSGWSAVWGQLLAIGVAGLVGLWMGPRWLALLALLLAALPLWAAAGGSAWAAQVDGFFRAGAPVFGGGHVVLPLLQATVVPAGSVSGADFLAGYNAAQAVPGPLFIFSAYLGAATSPSVLGALAPWQGGLILLVVLFAPAVLVAVGVLPFWDLLRWRIGARAVLTCINAGVVGLLVAAFIDPVWPAAILHWPDGLLAGLVLVALLRWRISPLWVVLGCSAAASVGSLF